MRTQSLVGQAVKATEDLNNKFNNLTSKVKERLAQKNKELSDYRKKRKLTVHTLQDMKAFDDHIKALTASRNLEQRFLSRVVNAEKTDNEYEVIEQAYLQNDYLKLLN